MGVLRLSSSPPSSALLPSHGYTRVDNDDDGDARSSVSPRPSIHPSVSFSFLSFPFLLVVVPRLPAPPFFCFHGMYYVQGGHLTLARSLAHHTPTRNTHRRSLSLALASQNCLTAQAGAKGGGEEEGVKKGGQTLSDRQGASASLGPSVCVLWIRRPLVSPPPFTHPQSPPLIPPSPTLPLS